MIIFAILILEIAQLQFNDDDGDTKILRFTQEAYTVGSNAHVEYIDDTYAANANQDLISVTVKNLDDSTQIISLILTEQGDVGSFRNLDILKFTDSPNTGILELLVNHGDAIEVDNGVISHIATIFRPEWGVEPTTIDRLRFGSDSYRINFEGRINANFNEDIFKDDPSLSPTAPDETQIYLSRTQPTGANPLPAGGFFVQMVETGDNTLRFQTEKIRYTTQPNDPNGVPIKMQTAVGEKVWAVHQYPGRSDVLASTRIIAEPPSAPTPNFVPPVDTPRFDCGTPIQVFDSDGDGICDEFEDGSKGNGLIIDAFGTTYEYNDPTTGDCRPQIFNRNDLTNPNYGQYLNPQCPGPDMPDLYVEIDFMTGHSPSSLALFDVVDLFYQNGIRLHLQIDENVGFHTNQIKLDDDQADFRKDGFRQQKEAHFGSILEKAGLTQQQLEDKMTGKRQVFHYSMFIHHIEETPTASGTGEVWGNDFIISMGAFSQNVGTRNQQAGTLLHELGHNLNLRHNGDTDLPNCVPHYLSAMNYLYQFKDFTSSYTSPLDYSHSSLNPLNELALVEANGIQPDSEPIGLKAIIGGIDNAGNPLGKLAVDTGNTVNFNRDGTPDESTAIQQNIHWFDVDDCRDTVKQTLNSYDDWANLNFYFIDTDNFMDGVIYLETKEYDTSIDTYIRTEEISKLNLAIQNLPEAAFDSNSDDLIDDTTDPVFVSSSKLEFSDMFSGINAQISATPEDLTFVIFDLNNTVRTTIADKLVMVPYETDIITMLEKIINYFIKTTQIEPESDHSSPGTGDQIKITAVNSKVSIELIAGDPNNDSISYTIESAGPSHGTITNFDPLSGTLDYEPDSGFMGRDEFKFSVTDSTGLNSNIGTVIIDVVDMGTILGYPHLYLSPLYMNSSTPIT